MQCIMENAVEDEPAPDMVSYDGIPEDAMADLLSQFLTGVMRKETVMNQLRHHFNEESPTNCPRAKALFERCFVQQIQQNQIGNQGNGRFNLFEAMGAAGRHTSSQSQRNQPAPGPLAASVCPRPSTLNPGVSASLQQAREQMSLSGIKQNRRAPGTFSKRNNENVTFILFLYSSAPDFLHDNFYHELKRADEGITYDSLLQKKYRGKKPMNERKAEFRRNTLRDVVKNALGGAGSKPTKNTANLPAIVANVEDSFIAYLCNRLKSDGALMAPDVYSGYRSGLTYLFSRYKYTRPTEFMEKVSDLMKGVKRVAKKSRQVGEVSSSIATFLNEMLT